MLKQKLLHDSMKRKLAQQKAEDERKKKARAERERKLRDDADAEALRKAEKEQCLHE